jgi:hypothetical protein
MRDTMKKALTAMASLALIPAAAAALEVRSPHPGTVTATTYYSSGSFHGAVDVSGNCNLDPLIAPIGGSLYWDFTIRTTGVVCYGSGSGTQNEVKHTFADGYTFRIWNFIKTANSFDKTCDRCELGLVGGNGAVTGPNTHLQYDKNGTNNTSWYSGTTKGEFLDRGEAIGYIQ